jgi:hypothetical protein
MHYLIKQKSERIKTMSRANIGKEAQRIDDIITFISESCKINALSYKPFGLLEINAKNY